MKEKERSIPNMGTLYYLLALMRAIAISTLNDYWRKYPECEQSLKSWLRETLLAGWDSQQTLKHQFKNASIITGKRIVFNINGNRFRLLVDIEFRLQIIFIVWFGSHNEYNQIKEKRNKM